MSKILFVVGELFGENEGVYAAFVEKEYFSKNGFLDDRSPDFNVVGWSEASESVYEPDDMNLSVEDAYKDLVRQGFVYSEALATALEWEMVVEDVVYRPKN